MNATLASGSPRPAARLLFNLGSLALLVGAIDPMEGSLLILPGSGLMALATHLGHGDRRWLPFRIGAFILTAIGVGALWGLSSAGGVGGASGPSLAWGALVLPFLVGWFMGICGPETPRWMSMAGIGVGLWYLTIFGIAISAVGRTSGRMGLAPILVLGTLGLLTVTGCLIRLVKRAPALA